MSFRVEKKFFIKKDNLIEFKEFIKFKQASILYPKRVIQSLYFENNSKQMYFDSVEGLTPRKKIRIRNYPDSKNLFFQLETKISSIEGRYKKNIKINKNDYKKYLKLGVFDQQYGHCTPFININYNREYFKKDDMRITIDTDIKYNRFKSKLCIKKEDNIIVELKTNINKDIDLLFKEFPFQEIRFSKYCNGVEIFNLN